jgi:hypothetical protein
MIIRCGEIQRGARLVSKHVCDSVGKTITGRNSNQQHLLNDGIEGASIEFSDIGK